MSGPLVVAAGYIGSAAGWAKLPGEWTAMNDVARYAVEHDASTVYMMQGIADWAGDHDEVTGDQGGTIWRSRSRVGDKAVSIVWLREDVTQAAGPWEGLAPRELASAFDAFERLCGVPWGDSTGHTAEALILAQHPREKGGVPLDREPDTRDVWAGSGLEQPWAAWRRDPTQEELASRYVHAFDANAQYLAAWGTVELGHGRPVHHSSPVFDRNTAGFWRIPAANRLRPAQLGVTQLLPAPWLPDREWFSTPTVRRMLEVCDGLEAPDIAESWTWPKKSRFLLGAANKLRDAREAAMTEVGTTAAFLREMPEDDQWDVVHYEIAVRRHVVAGAVLDAVKALYRVQTGRFGMEGRASTSPWARPDWGHMVRAQARVNMHRRLAKLGQAPFAIATDGVLFATDEPDPVAFATRIRLPLGRALGEYRHTGSEMRARWWDYVSTTPRGVTVAAMFQAIGADT